MFFCNRVVVQAPAKINLSLDITGTTDNGYHTLDTIMQTIDLCDIVVVGRRAGQDIRITCSRPNIPEGDTNIAHQAAVQFFAQVGLPVQGLSIHIDKIIPVEAGLAGGSADAAAVLWGLNRLLETSLTTEQLCAIGDKVGADVPFCVVGGACLAQGKGEIMTALPALPQNSFITIAKPPKGMNTRYAFKLYDTVADQLGHPDTAAMVAAMKAGELAEIGRCMFNVFEQVSPMDEVEMLKGIMLVDGAAGAVMSGSGSAVAGIFADEKKARRSAQNLKQVVEEAYLARPLTVGAQIIHVS